MAFAPSGYQRSATSAMRMGLDSAAIEKLDSLKMKYDALSSQTSPEAQEEKALIDDIIQKYSTYKEIKLMMNKLRKMWRTEESDRRRSRQLNSFISLYKGRREVEVALKEKLGISEGGAEDALEVLNEVEKMDAEIAALEKQLDEIEVKLPKGMSTREERFDL
eukprot:CAMPEP_0182427496 /NCGR_PEP_ID=MMETSP1167-20130531/17894_1 /TAXON_ID=2988 /ORGANISM="Mallomonas Sp, Strain CCMP3275" /LENGTH=162 /DNA_ID=CAMNT_0024609783 /DNA_START=108 /DNA_END=596 /DNA_ORIENTATION=-